jgi:capsular exopolysaccharide synthesis family protein
MDLGSYLRALRRNWWIVVLATLLGGSLAFLVAKNTPEKYQSSVTFFVSTPTDAAGTAVQADQYAQRRVNSYVQLLSSDSLAKMIIDSTGLSLNTSEVTSKIKADAEPETVLLTATVTDESAARSLVIAQGISQQFGKMVDKLDNRGSPTKPTVQLNVTSGPTLNPVPVAPRTSLIVGLGVLVGLSLGIAGAILRETLDKTIRSAETLRRLTEVPVLAVIAFDKKAKRLPLIVDTHSRTARAESFRQLRTNLQFVDAANPVRVLVVTSSLTGEGKSTTAANLAVSFADYGQRVILIDADLRRPRIAGYMGVEGSVGLTNVLVGQSRIDDVLQEWGQSGLTVLPSGAIPPNPSELLGSRMMADLLSRLRQRSDLIIIDTPPLLPVTDAAVVSRIADGTLMIVRHGRTTRHQASTAFGALRTVNARILGTVLSMTPEHGGDAYSRYGYSDDAASVQPLSPGIGNSRGHEAPPLSYGAAGAAHHRSRSKIGLRAPLRSEPRASSGGSPNHTLDSRASERSSSSAAGHRVRAD